MEILATYAPVALFAGSDPFIRNLRQHLEPSTPEAYRSRTGFFSGLIGFWVGRKCRHNTTLVLLIGAGAIFLTPACAQLGFHKKTTSTPSSPTASDNGMPKEVLYGDQKYLVTSQPGGMVYSIALEGSPTPLGMVVKMPNAPVQYNAFNNSLETAKTLKAVYDAFLHPSSSSGDAASADSADSITVTSFDAARKEATVQTSTGPIRFTNGLNDFEFMIGSNPVHGHFSDGSNAAEKTGHVLKSLGHTLATGGIASKQMYAGSVIEFSVNHGPKSAIGESGKGEDMGPAGASLAANILYIVAPVANTMASAASKAAEALGLEKPKYLPILSAMATGDYAASH